MRKLRDLDWSYQGCKLFRDWFTGIRIYIAATFIFSEKFFFRLEERHEICIYQNQRLILNVSKEHCDFFKSSLDKKEFAQSLSFKIILKLGFTM